MSKAQRRRDYRRIKRNRSGYSAAWNGDGSDAVKGMTATTPKRCNCWMCSNHRKHEGEPFSDKRRKGGDTWSQYLD